MMGEGVWCRLSLDRFGVGSVLVGGVLERSVEDDDPDLAGGRGRACSLVWILRFGRGGRTSGVCCGLWLIS